MHNFALSQIENLHHLSNLHDNFRFNAIWHGQSMAALMFCKRLAESEVTVMPTVTCMDWLHWWYNYVAHWVSSLPGLALREKCKSSSPSAIQVKNWQNAISNEEKLETITWLEKVNELLTYNIMLDSLTVAYLQFVIMLIEL